MSFPIFRLPLAALIILLGLGFSSCDTDFDLNAEYKETPAIYGFVDLDTTYQRFKITRAFSNEDADALSIAKSIPDSSRYGSEMSAVLSEVMPGGQRVDYPLVREPVLDKDTGLFFSADEQVFSVDMGKIPSTASSFIITTENTATGVRAVGKTNAVGDFAFTSPVRLTFALPRPSNPNLVTNISWAQPTNGNIFDLKAYVTYTDFRQPAVPVRRVLVWNVQNGIRGTGGAVTVGIPSSSFFEFMNNNVDPAFPDSYRLENISFEATAGSTDYFNYVLISRNFSPVSQVQPTFSNINGGVGLFAARNKSEFGSIGQGTYDAVYSNGNFDPNPTGKFNTIGEDLLDGLIAQNLGFGFK